MIKSSRLAFATILAGFLLSCAALRAWDYEGHRIVNQLALAALPKEFPAFVREPAAAERLAFLAGEPDRWRNVPGDLPLSHVNGMDHYLDLEELADAGLDPTTVSSFRYDFVVAFAQGRAAHLENFVPIQPDKNLEHSREWPGFAPWAIAEYYGKLKSAFSYLKAYEELGRPEEVANAQANILYVMGLMGHYVGDCAQPLHATVHHHGWVGANPKGYTTWTGIHAWIDGGVIAKARITSDLLRPRVTAAALITLAPRADGRDPLFVAMMDYIIGTQKLVEPLYQLQKDGQLGDDKVTPGADGRLVHEKRPVTTEGRAFIETQLLRGGEMLGAVWLTAWRNAPPDIYLRSTLLRRQAAMAPVPAKTAP
jgi:hypothetical protein